MNCSTAFINYAAQFGETIQQLFDSDAGILGLMNYFEQQGSGSKADQQVWAALDWVFLDRWNLSASDKAWFYGPRNIPTSFAATVTMGNTRSQVFTSSGQLTAGNTTTLLNILTGSPDSKECQGLSEAFDVAQGTLDAYNLPGYDPAFFEKVTGLLVMTGSAYSLSVCGNDRFVVVPAGKTSPVLGYISRKPNKTWCIERRGQLLRETYPSASEAATALANHSAKQTIFATF